jgi:thiol-disulfide isomerase/thioredoxin
MQFQKMFCFILAFLFLFYGKLAHAQESGLVRVNMQINKESPQDMMVGQLKTKTIDGKETITVGGETYQICVTPSEVLAGLRPLNNSSHGYYVRIDTNSNGKLDDEQELLLEPSGRKVIQAIRQQDQRRESLPYSVAYNRYQNRQGEWQELFFWVPGYRAEGKLRVGDCEALLVVLDLYGDGVFDKSDFQKATTIGIDRNGDGRIWGIEEWLKGNQLIEFCGKFFLIDQLAADGTSITLKETVYRVPEVGDQLPVFALLTTENKPLRSEQFKGKIHLLDFWASWCVPCVEKFPLVKELDRDLAGRINVVAVNVDDQEGLKNAQQIIEKFQLRWPLVMQGKGEEDVLWKMFGGMENNRLKIPLYVVSDQQGIIRYAGNGGEKLVEVKRVIEGLPNPMPSPKQ